MFSPLFCLTLSHPNVKHFFCFSNHLRLLFSVGWFCGDRVVQPSFGHHLSIAHVVYSSDFTAILDITERWSEATPCPLVTCR